MKLRTRQVDPAAYSHLYPFDSHYHRSKTGLRYHYVDEGQGQPLVFLHGNPTWSFYFRQHISALSEHYRAIAPDHMGCGLSDKPSTKAYWYRLRDRVDDLAALIDALRLTQPVTLILHDWGGMIGLVWALEHPEQVGRLVITNTSGFFPPRGKKIPRRLRWIRTPNRVMDWSVLHLNLFARAALYMAPRKTLSPAVRAGLIAPYNAPANRLATLRFVQDIPLSLKDPGAELVAAVDENLAQICRVPTLLLWGAHDFVFDGDYFQEWRRRLPEAEAHWFKNAGHYLFEDQPEATLSIIRRFLERHPLERTPPVHHINR